MKASATQLSVETKDTALWLAMPPLLSRPVADEIVLRFLTFEATGSFADVNAERYRSESFGARTVLFCQGLGGLAFIRGSCQG